MPGVMTSDQPRVEDLDPSLLILADERNSAFLMRVRKGKKIMNSPFGWSAYKMGDRRTDPIAEGFDQYAFEGASGTQLYNRKQKVWRTLMITDEAQEMEGAVGDALKDYQGLLKMKIEEQNRDIDTVLLSDRDAQENQGTVTNGEATMGLGRIINDGVSVGAAGFALTWGDQQTAIPAAYRTPTAQIYTGALASLTEDTFNDLLRARNDALGGSPELSMFCGTLLKAYISKTFGRYVADKAGYSTVLRITDTKSTTITKGIDVFEGDFGTIDISWDNWMPYTSRGYILAMEDIFLRSILWLRHKSLPDNGAGPRGQISTIFGLQYGSPLKHAKIDPAS